MTPRPTYRILRLPAVLAKVGVSRWTINRLEEQANFPRRVSIGPNSVGWYEHEVDDWLAKLRQDAEATTA